MTTFFAEVRQTLLPRGDTKDGPLPLMLVAMTLVTGLVDAFSYLVLGHVFVANMTGNVVFLAFALAGAPGFSITASLLALGSFIIGALSGGLLGSRLGHHRGHMLSVATAVQTLLRCSGGPGSAVGESRAWSVSIYVLVMVLAILMGIQNAIARKLAVPDLTTTVLTLTIVGIGADSRIAGGSGSRAGRRLIAVVAMFVGALLIFHMPIFYPLVVALAVTATVVVTARMLSRTNQPWINAV